MDTQFEWDDDKARTNLRKHKVSFEEAATVFDDPLAHIFDDEEHSGSEERNLIIGESRFRRLLLVVFTERAVRLIRIVGVRLADRRERYKYEENTNNRDS